MAPPLGSGRDLVEGNDGIVRDVALQAVGRALQDTAVHRGTARVAVGAGQDQGCRRRSSSACHRLETVPESVSM